MFDKVNGSDFVRSNFLLTTESIHCWLSEEEAKAFQQESIPFGCILPAINHYNLRL